MNKITGFWFIAWTLMIFLFGLLVGGASTGQKSSSTIHWSRWGNPFPQAYFMETDMFQFRTNVDTGELQERLVNKPGNLVTRYINTSNMTKTTIIQSLILGLVIGPVVWLLMGNYTVGAFIWDCAAMFLVPIIVDFIRSTICY